jgi:hypothetical protein
MATAVVRLASELSPLDSGTALTGNDGRFDIRIAAATGRFLLTAHRVGFPPVSLVVSLDTLDRPWSLTMRPALAILDPLVTTVKRIQAIPPRRDPGSAGTGLNSATALRYPYDPGDLAALASFLNPSIVQAIGPDGEPLGIAAAGQLPGAVNATLDGATTSDLQLPAEAVSAVRTFTSTYDVSRGQFTSALIAARTRSGTDQPQAVLSVKGSQPLLGSSPSGRGSTTFWDPRSATLSGGAGGPLIRRWLYAYAAADVTRMESAPPSILESSGPAPSLLGVSRDSVARFMDIANRIGLGPTLARSAARTSGVSTNAVLRLDAPLTENHTATVRLNWVDRRTTPVSPLSISGSGGTRVSDGRGLYAAFTSTRRAIENEARAYMTKSAAHGDPSHLAPQAAVRVGSIDDDTLSLAILTAGGSSSASAASAGHELEFSDDFSWAPGQGFARLTAGVIGRSERVERQHASNPFGTFTFASLSDLDTGRPLAFSRTLDDGINPAAVTEYGGGYLGGAARMANAFVTLGVRADAQRYGRRDVASGAFAVAPSALANIPTDVLLSPRFGFRVAPRSWLTMTGGSGIFREASRSSALVGPIGEIGTSVTRRLSCVGPSAPSPAWSQYLGDPGTIPVACGDDQSVFASRRPAVTLFNPDFHAPRQWRNSIGALASIGALNSISLEASQASSRTMPLAFDRNLNDAPAFTMSSERDRPVYVPAAEIDSGSGGLPFSDSRKVAEYGIVRELTARGRSSTFQLETRVGGVLPWSDQSGIGAVSYAFTSSRMQATGVSGLGVIGAATAASPNDVEWVPAPYIPRHSIDVTVARAIRGPVSLGLLVNLRSGVPYTPLVLGDVNGDGISNDRAFVFDPSQTRDTAIQNAMQRLLSGRTSAARCLDRQRNAIAAPGSCRTDWTRSANASVIYLRRSTGATVTLSAINMFALLDRAIHGRSSLHGWGAGGVPDENLLIVRGFDRGRQTYLYEVNPTFGASRVDVVTGNPFALQLRVRVPVSGGATKVPADPASAGREIEGMLRSVVVNTPARLLRLSAERSLELSPSEIIRLHLAMDSLQSRIDVNVTALTRSLLDDASARTPDGQGRRRALKKEAQDIITSGVEASRRILGERWTEIPDAIRTPSLTIPDGVIRTGRPR